MRIAACELLSLSAALARPFSWSGGEARERAVHLVRLRTDSGPDGWGEIRSPTAVPLFCDLKHRLIGCDAIDPDAALRLLHGSLRGLGSARDRVEIAGGVEIALGDLAGRWRGIPFHAVLGLEPGRPPDVPAYASGLYYSDADVAVEVEALLGLGCPILKMKIGRLSIDNDLDRIDGVLRLIGGRARLAADANQAYDDAAAVAMSAAMAQRGMAWFEEPLAVAGEAEYARLALASGVPLAAGENVSDARELAVLLAAGTLDVAQPNVVTIGGPGAALQVAAAAARHDRLVALHGWGGPVLRAATVHVAACSASGGSRVSVEIDCTPNPLLDRIAPGALPVRDGHVAVPRGPGLGLELDVVTIERLAVRR